MVTSTLNKTSLKRLKRRKKISAEEFVEAFKECVRTHSAVSFNQVRTLFDCVTNIGFEQILTLVNAAHHGSDHNKYAAEYKKLVTFFEDQAHSTIA